MNQPPTILIVGWGSAGRRHARNLRELGCENLVFLRSGLGNSPDDESPPGVVVSTLEEAVAQKPFAAVISTPSARHLDIALPLAERGCHLFVEKPLADDGALEACREFAALARERKIVTMVGCQYRFHPLLRALRDGLRERRLGKVLRVRAEYREYLPDWHPWEDYRTSYAARADLGGGVLLTLIHPIDYLYWLFGEVDGVEGRYRKIPGLDTSVPDDWAEITLQFRSGVVGEVHLDYIQKPPVHQLSVWGDGGRVDLDFLAGRLCWTMPGEEIVEVEAGKDFSRNDMFMDEMRDFLGALDSRQPTESPVGDGIAVLEIVARARRDAASRLAGGSNN